MLLGPLAGGDRKDVCVLRYLFIYFWLLWVFVAAPGLFHGSFSHGGAQALGTPTSVAATCRLRSCGTKALELVLSGCGAQA